MSQSAAGADTLPNLLVIGAQKAGSTWLHERLNAHPDVFMSYPKELRFFGHADKTSSEAGLADYHAHFAAGKNHRYRGESTPAYFWSNDPDSKFATDLKRSNLDIPPVVKHILGPSVSLILSLRNPIARAISAFYHHYNNGDITARDSIRDQGHRWGIVDMGFYRRHIEAWLAHFNRDRMHIVLFDDIFESPDQVVRQLFQALQLGTDVDDPNLYQPSNAGKPRLALQDANNGANLALGNPDGPKVEAADLQYLCDLYRDDIGYVEYLLSRPLPHWYSTDPAQYL